MMDLRSFNLLTDNNFDAFFTAWKGSAQQHQVIFTIGEIIKVVHKCNYNSEDEQNPVAIIFDQKHFDVLYQLNSSTLDIVKKSIKRMDFDKVLTATLFNDLF